MKYDDQITTRVDSDTTERVEKLANDCGVKKSALIRQLLQTGLEVAEKQGVSELAAIDSEPKQPAD
ncbi:hypothetical protein C2R22_05765 [Salinigranum rubrum]|uniref:Ribbon-helix-helix protein CopG domain-containing protein n=1 Tax=Salinigranum rubrum TaxID=755307 RepID=A0A2I8VH21_9EURY|nr:ribbon-helix-helix domain-containing protein [Salinigranum rubrum]AUV81225.1 hypothetical protein C2R22_05765 [Salinigranum rubrum]